MSDIHYAQFAHIDAFALNMANGEEANLNSLDLAFAAAVLNNFKLVFSFDYAGNGNVSITPSLVLAMCTRYSQSPKDTLVCVKTYEMR